MHARCASLNRMSCPDLNRRRVLFWNDLPVSCVCVYPSAGAVPASIFVVRKRVRVRRPRRFRNKIASSNIAPFRPLSTPPTGFRFSKRTKQTLLSFTGCRIHFQPISVAGDGRYLFYAPVGGRRPLWGRTGAIFVGRNIRAYTATRDIDAFPYVFIIAGEAQACTRLIVQCSCNRGPNHRAWSDIEWRMVRHWVTHGPTSSDAAGVARRERGLRWLLRNEAV